MIFDSCIWIGLASNQVDRQSVLDAAKEEPIYTSAISLGELSYGVEACDDPSIRAVRAAYLRQLEARPILDITRNTASAFGVLAAAVKRTGRSPRPRYNDLWIAAQAIEHGYTLLTLNSADFAHLPGLRLITLPTQVL